MFPNKYSIYLHDTPAKYLFNRNTRAYSHGCIRIQKPIEMAEFLLEENGWDREQILEAMNKGEDDHHVVLDEPLPVHILYCTAWVDENGAVNFRQDIYGRDAPLAAALGTEPPAIQ